MGVGDGGGAVGVIRCRHQIPSTCTPNIMFLLEFRSLHFENVGKCEVVLHVKERTPNPDIVEAS